MIGEIESHTRALTSDEFTPEGITPMDHRSKVLLDAALGLAGDPDWDDDAAVNEVLRLADGHSEALTAAENNARARGDYLDLEIENRAQRLLKAALTGGPVGQPSDADKRRFAAVEPFADLETEEAWAELAAALPELRELAKQASSQPPLISVLNRQLSSERQAFDAAAQARLRSLLGPECGSDDPLLSSGYALRFAMDYLLGLHRSNP